MHFNYTAWLIIGNNLIGNNTKNLTPLLHLLSNCFFFKISTPNVGYKMSTHFICFKFSGDGPV